MGQGRRSEAVLIDWNGSRDGRTVTSLSILMNKDRKGVFSSCYPKAVRGGVDMRREGRIAAVALGRQWRMCSLPCRAAWPSFLTDGA
jgi:hypothetical protein